MSDVPPEILVFNIFLYLQVKSLLRFRSVSKSVCALIDSPYFVKLHRQQQSMKTEKLIVFSRGICPSTYFNSLSLDSLPTAVELDPRIDTTLFPHIICSLHGLIGFCSWPLGRIILLWNPSTRKCKEIPASLDYPNIYNALHAVDQVGYDHVNDDYKVVRLVQTGTTLQFESKFFLYSLKLESWQSVEQKFPYNFLLVFCGGQGVCVSGAAHWLLNKNTGGPDKDYLMVSFDFASQSFQSVPQPECFNNYPTIELGALGGCLCVVGSGKMHCADVWVMGEYAVKESWNKLIALTWRVHMTHVPPRVRPLAYLKNRKEVLLEINEQWFVIYDLEEKNYKQTILYELSPMTTFVYEESLV